MEKIEINNETKIVFDSLEGAGYECFMVGGCVRDYLRGVPPHDIDFATSATPEQIKECFAGYHIIETGIKHGTVTVIIRHIPFEISTYKTDTFRLGEPAARATIHDDLAHRDLTINAIAYHPERGFIDSFEGRRDLERGIIRSVNDPVDRFTEDPLRILRVLRFAAMLGFKIEAQTLSVCVAMAPALKNISPERIRDELCKTIVAPHGHEIMLRFVDIWGAVIPEILKMKGFEQKNPHHIYDVLEHTCVALANTKPELPLRLAVLFHDIGKPECFTIDERGVGHFYGHAKFSADIARAIINRLKFDNDTKANVLTLIKYHDLDIQPNFRYLKKLSYKLGGLDMVKSLVCVQRADISGQAPGHEDRLAKLDKIDEAIALLEQESLTFSLKDLAVDGYDMIANNITGSEIGKSLKFLLQAVLDENVKNEKADLIAYLLNHKPQN